MDRRRIASYDLDADTTQRVERSFLVVRVVRGSLLLLFLAFALVAVELRNWPRDVAVAIAVTMLIQTGTLAASIRRSRPATRRPLSR